MTHLKTPIEGIYPPEWTTIARQVKDAADWRCTRCHHPHDPTNGYTLTVHHWDHNTFNNHPDNLIALCQRCHLREEGRYRNRIRADRLLNEIQASGQTIFDSFLPYLFPPIL